MGSGIFWLWRSISNILKDIRKCLSGELSYYLPLCPRLQQNFHLSEVNNLVFNSVLLMIVLALDDNAFESNVKSVRDIF